eukprot:1249268-Pleurochrysis_carterae.AAC.2
MLNVRLAQVYSACLLHATSTRTHTHARVRAHTPRNATHAFTEAHHLQADCASSLAYEQKRKFGIPGQADGQLLL